MKKKMKRIAAVLLLQVLLVSVMSIDVFATQSCSDNFNKNYTLTGNGAEDICTVALAQYEKTGKELGYTENWCGDFASDCAKLAGLESVIPAHGGVSYLCQNILNAGGVEVSTPQAGDIAIIDWNKNGRYSHVEIVYEVSGNTVYTIGGNSGPNADTSLYAAQVWKHQLGLTSGYFTKFVRPAYPAYVEPSTSPFEDLYKEEYYYDPVLWAVENGIASGMTETRFEPGRDCTRAQVVTFLWRAFGCPTPTETKHNFTDINPDQYYYEAVLWAVENGITAGMTDTEFDPARICTRGQVVTFLWRAQGCPTPNSVNHNFSDLSENVYYYDAALWAIENGVTNGMSETQFESSLSCTRGQVVTFLYRTYN